MSIKSFPKFLALPASVRSSLFRPALFPNSIRYNSTGNCAGQRGSTDHASTSTGSVNETEVHHFNQLASSWWDPHGSSRLLHLMNPLRHRFIRHCLTREEDLPDFIVTAYDIDYKKRIDVQAAWQQYIDASISSTVNVPYDFTVEEVEDLYYYAWKKGLKGVCSPLACLF